MTETTIREQINSWLESLNSYIQLLEQNAAYGNSNVLCLGVPVLETKLRSIKEFKSVYDENIKPVDIWFEKVVKAIRKPAYWNSTWYEQQILAPMNKARVMNATKRLGVIQVTLDQSDAIISRIEGERGHF